MLPRVAALLVVALLTPAAVHAACALSCAWPTAQSATLPEGGAATCHDQTRPSGETAIAGSGTIHCQDGAQVAAFALASRWAPDGSPFTLFATLSSTTPPPVPDVPPHSLVRLKATLRAAAVPLRI